MQTTIKSVDVEWVGSGAKKYGKAAVKHVGERGEKTQYLVSFKNPEVFKKVQEMIGQQVEVELKKDGDFWQWVSINTTGAASPSASASGTASGTATRVTGSNYETKEERAARQVLIVKQSSLSNAVAILSVGAKTQPAKESVTELAQYLTDWVFDKRTDSSGFDTMQDDIPF